MSAKKHILIVEDERHLAVLMKYNLEREGYRATTMADGPTAVAFVQEHADDVDLVILDLGLPDRDGQEVLVELREWSAVPVLVLSVRADEREKVRALDAGANDYVTKPFGIQEFLARSRALLRQTSATLLAPAREMHMSAAPHARPIS